MSRQEDDTNRSVDLLFLINLRGISRMRYHYSILQKDPQEFILELISFGEDYCDVPADEMLTKRFMEWFERNSEI